MKAIVTGITHKLNVKTYYGTVLRKGLDRMWLLMQDPKNPSQDKIRCFMFDKYKINYLEEVQNG